MSEQKNEGICENNNRIIKIPLHIKTEECIFKKDKENTSLNTGSAIHMKSPTAREQKMVPEKVMNLEIAIRDQKLQQLNLEIQDL